MPADDARSGEDATVRSIMSSPVETISRDATASSVAEKMLAEDISALLVRTNPPSIVTKTDLLSSIADEVETAPLSVTELMTESVETIPPELRVGEAAAMMTTFGINHLPVVEDGDYVGIVSSTDITAVLGEDY